MTERLIQFPNQRRIHDEACAWMIRLDGDSELSADELQSLSQWLQQSEAHRKELLRLAALWGQMNVLTELAVPLSRTAARQTRWQANNTWLAVSACVVMTIGGLLAWQWMPNPLPADNGLYETAIGEQRRSVLADGSIVQLNTNSRIVVTLSDDFRDVRLLQGEAHFTVTKDADRPFRVFAGVGSLQAIGTGFSVYLRDDSFDVMVTEGQVKVDTGSNQTTLAAGQGTSIRTEKNTATQRAEIVIKQVETIEAREISKRLSWREGILTFSGDSLGFVVEEISRYTTMSIEFSDPSVKSIRIGGRFPVGETEAMLNSLEKNFGLQVTRVTDNRVLLSHAGP